MRYHVASMRDIGSRHSIRDPLPPINRRKTPMNGTRLATALCSLTLLASTVQAIPTSGESAGKYYLVDATDLNSWHVGVYGRAHEREFKSEKVDINRGCAWLGYDLLPWATIYGLVGYSEMEPKDDYTWGGSDSAVEWGAGAWINLIDHDAMDFNELYDRFRIQLAAQYSVIDNDHVTYGEFSGYLTFGIVNEIRGSKEFWPDNIAVYVGPCVNVVHCDDFDQDSDDTFGIVAGLDVQLSRHISFGGSVEVYQDDTAYGGTVSVRF